MALSSRPLASLSLASDAPAGGGFTGTTVAGALVKTGQVATLSVSGGVQLRSPLFVNRGGWTPKHQPLSVFVRGPLPAVATVLATVPGSIVKTGQAAVLARAGALTTVAGSLIKTGQIAGLSFTRVLTTVPGSLVKTGQVATISFAAGYLQSTVPGGLVKTGQTTMVAYARNFLTVPGNLTKNGQVATLQILGSYSQSTVPGGKVLSGQTGSITLPRAGGGVYPYGDGRSGRGNRSSICGSGSMRKQAKARQAKHDLEVAQRKVAALAAQPQTPKVERREAAAKAEVERKHQQILAAAHAIARLHEQIEQVPRETSEPELSEAQKLVKRRRDDDDIATLLLLH